MIADSPSVASTRSSHVSPLVPSTTALNFVVSGTACPEMSIEKFGVSVCLSTSMRSSVPLYVPLDQRALVLPLALDALERSFVRADGREDAGDALDVVEIGILERVLPVDLRSARLIGLPRAERAVGLDASARNRVGDSGLELCRRVPGEFVQHEIVDLEDAGQASGLL